MVVVVVPPAREHLAGVGKAVEHLLIEALVTELAVEALDEAVLLGLARRDVMPGDAGLVLLFQNSPAGQLCAIVRHDGLGLAVEPDTAVKLSDDACA